MWCNRHSISHLSTKEDEKTLLQIEVPIEQHRLTCCPHQGKGAVSLAEPYFLGYCSLSRKGCRTSFSPCKQFWVRVMAAHVFELHAKQKPGSLSHDVRGKLQTIIFALSYWRDLECLSSSVSSITHETRRVACELSGSNHGGAGSPQDEVSVWRLPTAHSGKAAC